MYGKCYKYFKIIPGFFLIITTSIIKSLLLPKILTFKHNEKYFDSGVDSKILEI